MKEHKLDHDAMAEIALENEAEIKAVLPEYSNALVEDLGLSPAEIIFVYYYIESSFDGAAAYMKAFQIENKYTAKFLAKKLIARPNIQQAYQRILGEVWRSAVVRLPHRVMQQYENIVELDLLDFYNDANEARILSEIPKDKRKLIENIEYVMNSKTGATYVRYVLPTKEKALAALLALIKLHGEIGGDSTKGNDIDAEKKRREIFSSVDFEDDMKTVDEQSE